MSKVAVDLLGMGKSSSWSGGDNGRTWKGWPDVIGHQRLNGHGHECFVCCM